MSIDITKVKSVIERSVFAERLAQGHLSFGCARRQLNSELIHSGAVIGDHSFSTVVKLVNCWMRGEI